MKKTAPFFLLLALGLTPLMADPVKLSIGDAVELARKASLELYGQSLTTGAARRELDNTWNLFLPGISPGLSGKWSDELFSAPLASTKPLGSTVSLGTRLTITTSVLYDIEKRRTDYQSALLAERDADARVDLEKSRLAMTVAASATKRYVATNRLPLVTLDAGWNFSLTDLKSARDAFSLSAGLSFNADAWMPNSRKDLELRSLRETEARLAVKYEQDRRTVRDEIEALFMDIGFARNSLDVAAG